MRCDDEKDEHPLMMAAKWIVPAVILMGRDGGGNWVDYGAGDGRNLKGGRGK